MISKRSNTASAKGRDALCVPVQKVKDMEEVSDNGRVASDRALVSDQAPAGLDPSGFDPSRMIAELARQITAIKTTEPSNPIAPIVRCVLEHVLVAVTRGASA